MDSKVVFRSLIVVLLLIVLGIGIACASDVAAGKYAKVIVLKHVGPMPMMSMLGLLSQPDLRSDRGTSWRQGDGVAGSAATPDMMVGVDSVTCRTRTYSMTIVGEELAVRGLADLIGKLDVEPRYVMVEATLCRLDVGAEKALFSSLGLAGSGDQNGITVGYADSKVVEALESKLASLGAPVLNKPAVTTLNNTPAQISAGSFDSGTSYAFAVTPRINDGDRSITVRAAVTVTDRPSPLNGQPGGKSEMTVNATKRIGEGESLLLAKPSNGTERAWLIIITPSLRK